MKRFLSLLAAALLCVGASHAQFGINHLAVSGSVSTNGIGVELATQVTQWGALRAGVSFMPNFKFGFDADVDANIAGSGVNTYPIDIDLATGRTQGDVILNIYPFTQRIPVYVAAGVYFGGSKILDIKGHSNELEQGLKSGAIQSADLQIGDYQVPVDKNGNVTGYFKTKSVRPYFGLGYGSAIPGRLLSFNVELGVQVMGKMKIYDGTTDKEVPQSVGVEDVNDDLRKVLDKLTVYPVLKFTLSGKIF